MNKKKRNNQHERGNVLFLILIVGALFAALSYVVLSSTSTGGGNAASENTLVKSAAITLYPATLKTYIVRMTGLKNIPETEILFDPPPFDNLSPDEEGVALFHPNGGEAVFERAPHEVMKENEPGDWFFNMNFEVEGIGTSAKGLAGNEMIAFLPNIKSSICKHINEELGITGDIEVDTILSVNVNKMMGYSDLTTDPAENRIGGADLGASALNGQFHGCFKNGTEADAEFVYYHVLLEQ